MKGETFNILIAALAESVRLEMDDFNDDLDKAAEAFDSMVKSMYYLRESLGESSIESVKKNTFQDTYGPYDGIDRVKLFNDIQVLQVNTQALVSAFTQYMKNNATLLSATGTELELRIVGNPTLPDIVIKGANGEKTG